MNSLAALGTAWWIVGCIVGAFATYYSSRRAMLDDDSIE
jgi:hypothetical protein